MAYWLFKTEPSTWSWDDQVRKGEDGEPWNGVRNHLADKHMKTMRRGDRGFFYHSGDERRIMGLVEVIREHYPDHTDPSGRFGMVDVKAAAPFPRPVTLAEIRAEPRLAGMVLVRNSRLSVQPVTEAEWRIVCAMGGAAA